MGILHAPNTKLVLTRSLVALVLVLLAPRILAQKNKSLARQQLEFLNQRLLNQTLESKVLIGNCLPHSNPLMGKPASFYEDTEIRPDNSMKYLRRVVFDFAGTGRECLASEPLDELVFIPIGTRVVVGRIEMKDNRFELALKGPGNSYGRLKFFYGGDFPIESPPLRLLFYVSRALRVEAFERIEQANQSYRSLVWNLANTLDERRYPSSSPPQQEDPAGFQRIVEDVTHQIARAEPGGATPVTEQVKRMRTAQSVVERILRNREEYQTAIDQFQAAIAFEPVERELWLQAAEGGRTRLVELEARAKEERKRELESQLANRRQEYDAQKALLPKAAPRSLEELNRANLQKAKCVAVLEEWRTLLKEAAGSDLPILASDQAEIDKEQRRLQQLGQEWEGLRCRLALPKLDEDYIQVRIRLNGVPASDRNQRRELLLLLQANRENAVKCGSAPASKQLQDIKKSLAALD